MFANNETILLYCIFESNANINLYFNRFFFSTIGYFSSVISLISLYNHEHYTAAALWKLNTFFCFTFSNTFSL